MLENEQKIAYKKLKHKRSPAIWDIEFLYNYMQSAVALREIVEQMSVDRDTAIESLENISLPAPLIWGLADAYVDAYERLMREGLINSGNISKIQPTLN